MKLFDGFPFKTKQQQQQEQQAFEARVFPLGLAQRQAAAAVLARLITNKRHGESERLFNFIISKDAFTQADTPEEGMQLAAKALREGTLRVGAEDAKQYLALLWLDSQAPSLEDYPTAEQVQALAGQRGGGWWDDGVF